VAQWVEQDDSIQTLE